MTVAKQVTATRRLWVAASALGRTAAASLTVAVPPLAGGLVVVAVLMGPTGMQPSDAAEAMRAAPPLRCAIWAAWVAAFAPAALAVGRAELGYYRWLPIPALGFWSVWATFLAIINAPMALFWLLAGGGGAAAAALALTVAFHAALLTRGATRIVLLSATAAILVIPPTPTIAAAAAGAVITAIAIPLGWRRAGESRRFALTLTPTGSPTRALSTLLVNDVAEPLLLLRMLVAALVFGGAGGLLVSANQLSPSDALLVGACSAVLGSVGVASHTAARVTASWRELRWLTRSLAMSANGETAALLITAGLSAALCGSLIAVTTAIIGGSPLATTLLMAASGAAGAITSTFAAVAAATRVDATKSASVWLAAVITATIFLILIAAVGALGLIVLPALVVLATAYTHDAAASAEVSA